MADTCPSWLVTVIFISSSCDHNFTRESICEVNMFIVIGLIGMKLATIIGGIVDFVKCFKRREE